MQSIPSYSMPQSCTRQGIFVRFTGFEEPSYVLVAAIFTTLPEPIDQRPVQATLPRQCPHINSQVKHRVGHLHVEHGEPKAWEAASASMQRVDRQFDDAP